ncbi:MAG: hypothetical protein QHH75_08585 [Bacillota bacterium]|nr:hypothetical protein [Bacillota bacterium]
MTSKNFEECAVRLLQKVYSFCFSAQWEFPSVVYQGSSHIHGPGIEETVETIRPEILIPVHTENRDFFRRFQGTCRVV